MPRSLRQKILDGIVVSGLSHVSWCFADPAMTIKVQCPSCSKRYAVKKRLNGRKIRCVDCSAVISIPITDSNEKQTSDSRSQSQQDKFAASASGEKSKASRRTAAPSGAEPRKALRSDAGAKPVARRRRTRAEASSRKNGAASIPTDSEARQRWLSTAFQSNEIEPIAPTWSYRFAVFLVAILMIALPVIYIGLIGAIVVATWFLVSAIMSTAGPALGGGTECFRRAYGDRNRAVHAETIVRQATTYQWPTNSGT
jgi:predicted Zn finger-like uncharacterized protein